ncbi:MAG: DNA repair protein RecO [Armatimonadota bacterium]|nr:DNA repair protein RecO [Armatimonadota bacterium]
MPLYTANAIVLRRIDFGETDRITTLYTRELGKISAIAKGARKPISRLAGATETLTYGKFQLATGKTLDVITQVEVRHSFPRIRSNLRQLAYATYLAELVERFVEEREPNVDMFDLLLSSLYLLERLNDPEKIAHMFELQFMKLLGYEPTLDKCVRCRKPLSEGEVFFSPSLGGIVCRMCGPLPEDAIQISYHAVEIMRKLLQAEAPEVEKMEISPNIMEQIGRVMQWYIRYRSPAEIKSLRFFQMLKSNSSE